MNLKTDAACKLFFIFFLKVRYDIYAHGLYLRKYHGVTEERKFQMVKHVLNDTVGKQSHGPK
jgi:hypothetical protein